MPRGKYPSDHRRWIRLYEDVLDDPRLNALDLGDQMLYVRLLATLNRQKSRDGWGHLDTFAACSLARRERWAYAKPAFDRIAVGGLVTIRYRDGGLDYQVGKWPESQGYTPSKLRQDSAATPPPKTSPKTRRERERDGEKEPKRFDPIGAADLGLETLPLKTAHDLLMVFPRGVAETPETLATWFAWVAPRMRFSYQIKNTAAAARKWWPRIRREDIEQAREWLQIRRIESRREQQPEPELAAESFVTDDMFNFIGEGA